MTHNDTRRIGVGTPSSPGDAEQTGRGAGVSHLGGVEFAIAGSIFLFFVALYTAFPSRNYNYADDSLRWALGITQPSGLINSHHLYLNGARFIYRLLSESAGLSLNPASVLAEYSAICGALGLSGLFLMLRLWHGARSALFGTLLCAGTIGYWSYSIVGDVYVPAAACLILGFLAAAVYFRSPSRSAWALPLASAVALTLSILHHQACFVVVAALPLAAWIPAGVQRSRRLVQGFVVPVSTGIVVLLIYFAVWVSLPERDRQSFLHFTSGYAESYIAYPDMKQLSLGTALNAVAGEVRAIFSVYFLFSDPGITSRIQVRYPYRHVYAYPFLVRHMRRETFIALCLLAVPTVLLLAGLSVIGLWTSLVDRRPSSLLVVSAIPQAFFFAWWEAISDEFWIWSLPVVAVLAVEGAGRFRLRESILLGTASMALTALTFFGGIAYLITSGNDITTVNKQYLSTLAASDLLVGLDEIVDDNRVRLAQRSGFSYYNLFQRAEKGRPNDMHALATAITETVRAGGTVFVDPYVIDPPRSYLELIRLRQPHFEDELQAARDLIERLGKPHVQYPPNLVAQWLNP